MMGRHDWALASQRRAQAEPFPECNILCAQKSSGYTYVGKYVFLAVAHLFVILPPGTRTGISSVLVTVSSLFLFLST